MKKREQDSVVVARGSRTGLVTCLVNAKAEGKKNRDRIGAGKSGKLLEGLLDWGPRPS